MRSRDIGDLYVQAIVETPQNLTRRQRELLAEFERESSQKTHPESVGLFRQDERIFRGAELSAMRQPAPPKPTLADGGRFLRQLLSDPRRVGAIAPSGPGLARAMAAAAKTAEGWVVELGPGTGSVTSALLEFGHRRPNVWQSLNMTSNSAACCASDLPASASSRAMRSSSATRLRTFAARKSPPSSRACRCSTSRRRRARALLDEAFAMMGDDGVYVQFTYGLKAPIAHRRL